MATPDLGRAHVRPLGDDGWSLIEDPLLEKGTTAMRSFVAQPMRHGGPIRHGGLLPR